MVKKNALIVAGLIAIMLFAGISFAADYTFLASEDAYVDNEHVNTNYGASSDLLQVKDYKGEKKVIESLLKFSNTDLSALSGLNIVSASLWLYQYDLVKEKDDASKDSLNVHNVTGTWDESTVTWNNKPTFNASSASSITIDPTDAATQWRSWTGLEGLVSGWLATPGTNYGVLLEKDIDARNKIDLFFRSSEYSDSNYRPYLKVTATPEPVSSALFLIGGVALAARHLRRKKS